MSPTRKNAFSFRLTHEWLRETSHSLHLYSQQKVLGSVFFLNNLFNNRKEPVSGSPAELKSQNGQMLLEAYNSGCILYWLTTFYVLRVSTHFEALEGRLFTLCDC